MEDDLKISKVEYLTNHCMECDLWVLSGKLYCTNPLKEDNLKILKVEYLSNHLLDHTQILNFSLDDQTIVFKSSKWKMTPMEDYLKISKVEYLSNHLLDHTQILNFSLDDQTIVFKSSKWKWLQWKTTSKYQKWNISPTTVWNVTYEFLVGN